jgi:hypothetical protein
LKEPKNIVMSSDAVRVDELRWPWSQVVSPAVIVHERGTRLRLITGTWRDRKQFFLWIPSDIDPKEVSSFIEARTQKSVSQIDMRQRLSLSAVDAKWIAIISVGHYFGVGALLLMSSLIREPIAYLLLAFANPAWLYALFAEPRTPTRIAARGVGVMCASALAWFAFFGWMALHILNH